MASPLVGAVEAGNVSDMLEKPAPGPSILRLTDTEDKTPNKAVKPKAPEQSNPSKKSRQNRKKAEAIKAEKEEAEKERQVKLEAQRRLARQSEGRAAQDGSGFMAAKAANKAWTGNGINGKAHSQPNTNGFNPVQLLDTSESSAVRADTSKSSATDRADDWLSSLPSEEEQMEMLRKEEAWSTVKTKPRKGKKTGTEAEKHDENAKPGSSVAPKTAEPAKSVQNAASTNNHRPARPFKQQSSFAALSPAEPEEEAEWDV
jgi:hypothetical protein